MSRNKKAENNQTAKRYIRGPGCVRNTEVLFSGEKVEIGKPLKNNVRWKISAGGGGGGGGGGV